MGTEDYHYSDGFLQLDATGLNESMQGGSASRVAANINKKFPKKEKEESSGWGLSSLWGGSKKKPASNSTGASADLANSAADFESTAKLLEEKEKKKSSWFAEIDSEAESGSDGFSEVESEVESDSDGFSEVDSEAEDDLAEIDGENEQWELLADLGVAVGELAYDGLKGIGSGMSSLWNRATKSKKKPTKSASTVAGNIAKGSDKGLWGKASPGAASTVAGNIAAGPKRI